MRNQSYVWLPEEANSVRLNTPLFRPSMYPGVPRSLFPEPSLAVCLLGTLQAES
jgi:hypothetical protein